MQPLPLVLASTLFALAACTTKAPITSKPYAGSASPLDGVVYFLPKAKVKISYDPGANATALLTTERILYGDTRARYTAQANFSGSADDTVTIGVTNDQLLSTVTADTDDKSDEIVSTVIQGIRDSIREEREIAPSTKKSGDIKRQFLIDPYRAGNQNGATVRPLGRAAFPSNAQRATCPTGSSLCLPLMVPVEITYQGSSVIVVVPDPVEVIGITMKRTVCVNTQNLMTIENGILKEYKITKPSEVAGCASIPLDIVRAILAVPFDAITGRTARLSQKQKELDAELQLLKAQQALAAERAQVPAE